MSRARPTAQERTVSMFTGLTDLEGPNARDGSESIERERVWRKSIASQTKWSAVDKLWLGEWYAPPFWRIRWDKQTGEYVLSSRERVIDRYQTLTDAIAASHLASVANSTKVSEGSEGSE